MSIEAIGKQIASLRKEKGARQEELAKYQSSFRDRLIHKDSLPLGLVLTALLLVDAVVIDLMLTAIHILASLVKDVACVIKQIAYAYDDPCIQPLLNRT